jgi:long-chain acyl-CoA synthetase
MLLCATAVNTLADLFYQLEQQGRADLFMVRHGATFVDVDAATFADRVRRCAAALAALGVGPRDRIGLICSNRLEWHVIDFACHLRGAVLVPLFSTLTAAQVQYTFADSGCKVALAEGNEQVDKVVAVRDRLPALRRLVRIAPLPPVGDEPVPQPSAPSAGRAADADLDELLAAHDPAGDCPGPQDGDALATIIYTSGTTGEPKGVMLTHANLISNMHGSLEVLSCRAVDCSLSVLPLCHSFQRLVDYTFLAVGAQIAYGAPLRLAEEYLLVRPTVVAGVPRLFERFRAAVLEEVAGKSVLEQRIFRWAEDVGRRRAEHELNGAPWRLVDRLRHAVAERLVLRKVRAGCGGRIHHFVSGGAALEPSLNWWFESMGLRLLQGYGLTETSPVIAANRHDANRIGTVGVPLPGIEVRIAQDGEILTRGPHVMEGYWNKPDETAATIVDGWLHTGDIGTFEDGYLTVTDRKKHILVTSTGKNVAPQPLENALVMSSYIEQVSVVGDDRRFIAALIVPDFAVLAAWAAGNGKADDRAALCADAQVVELIRREIDSLQVDFARFERVRAFRLLEEPFTIEDGTLTPTLKVVRKAVQERYAALIDEMYREDEPVR